MANCVDCGEGACVRCGEAGILYCLSCWFRRVRHRFGWE